MSAPAVTFAPGEFIAEGLHERGNSEVEFADALGWPLSKAHWLIYHDGMLIEPDDIKAVAAYFDTSEKLWENLQVAHFDNVCQTLQEEAPSVIPATGKEV